MDKLVRPRRYRFAGRRMDRIDGKGRELWIDMEVDLCIVKEWEEEIQKAHW